MNETSLERLGPEGPPDPESRGELYLEKTRLEDEIQELLPSLRRRKRWGVGLVGVGILQFLVGVMSGNIAPGIFVCIIALIISMVPWMFVGIALSEIRGLRAAAEEIERRLDEGVESE